MLQAATAAAAEGVSRWHDDHSLSIIIATQAARPIKHQDACGMVAKVPPLHSMVASFPEAALLLARLCMPFGSTGQRLRIGTRYATD